MTRQDYANALRALSMDAVQHARSGHPGAPMGLADLATVLWREYLNHNPANPQWSNRDRFVLSNGHASILLYALLHLSGYPLRKDDLKQFRQLHSKTPGHPEYGHPVGVETTTGPLGQGFANAVGMALAERTLAAQFNRSGLNICDHRTYVVVGDGCLMEGISHEACSLAGTLRLGKLIAFYDANNISIDGEVGAWFADDTPARFRACNWHVTDWVDGHNGDDIAARIDEARAETDAPTLIPCRTIIGKGAPGKAGSAACHGAPLGEDEIEAARREMAWTCAPFEVPDAVCVGWDARQRGERLEDEWNKRFAKYAKKHPALAAEYKRRVGGELPDGWSKTCAARVATIAAASAEQKPRATRQSSGAILADLTADLPELIGGSADLAESNCVLSSASRPLHEFPDGNYIHYGVREFAMSAVASGIALHGGFIPYAATFLVFSDYARNAMRLAAMMKLRVAYVLTHDSIALGEDGPTHQPVEHLSSLRLIPNLDVWRPCDTTETAVAWHTIVERKDGPGAIALSRQALPEMPLAERGRAAMATTVAAIKRGGYIARDTTKAPRLVLIATGSEVALALAAAQAVDPEQASVRVVSMPCAEVFDRQRAAWREKVLPRAVPRVAIEAGSRAWWFRYVGDSGEVIGIDTFGQSAAGDKIYDYAGFTQKKIARVLAKYLPPRKRRASRATSHAKSPVKSHAKSRSGGGKRRGKTKQSTGKK